MTAKTELDNILGKARHMCQERGVRLTDKRKSVLSVVVSANEPLSAYQIADHYRDTHGKTLSVMSVYRMLKFLKDNNLVHRLETTNQYVACSHIACKHAHEIPQFLICDKCHGVDEVGIRKEILEEISTSIQDTGFLLGRQQFEFHGLCKECLPG